MDEEYFSTHEPELKLQTIPVCKCLRDDEGSVEQVVISARKQHILSTVARTEHYLRERRIPELIRFLFTKVVAQGSDNPIAYLEKLLDDCMLFRAGHGYAPVLYEKRHLQAIIKSFDPGRRGWLSTGQIRRAYITLGIVPKEFVDERVSIDLVLQDLKETQDKELFLLLSAGSDIKESIEDSETVTNTSTTGWKPSIKNL